MKSISHFLLLIIFFGLAGYSYGQQVAIGLELVGLPEQIYGASARLEPVGFLYVEAFGSTRPLRNRSTGGNAYIRREGKVIDLSFGVQKKWKFNNLDWSLSIGPYIQRKQFTGQQTCRFFGIGGCGGLLPERLDIKVTGIRLGGYFASDNGWYIQAYSGLGLAGRPPEEEVNAAKLNESVMIDHNGIFAHARIVLGWQFDMQIKK